MKCLPPLELDGRAVKVRVTHHEVMLLSRWLIHPFAPPKDMDAVSNDLVDELLSSPGMVIWSLLQSLQPDERTFDGQDGLRRWFIDHSRPRLLRDAAKAFEIAGADWFDTEIKARGIYELERVAVEAARAAILAQSLLDDQMLDDFQEARPWLLICHLVPHAWRWCEVSSKCRNSVVLNVDASNERTAVEHTDTDANESSDLPADMPSAPDALAIDALAPDALAPDALAPDSLAPDVLPAVDKRDAMCSVPVESDDSLVDRIWDSVDPSCPRDIVSALGDVARESREAPSEDTDTDVSAREMADSRAAEVARKLRRRFRRRLDDYVEVFPELLQREINTSSQIGRFQQRLEQAKLAAMKELAYGASHEINNPLANISTRAQTLLRDEVDPERREKLAMINSQAFRAHEMISNMMLFAHPPDIRFEPVSIAAIIDDVVAEMAPMAERHGADIRWRGNDDTPAGTTHAEVDATHLAVMMGALIRNSIEAMGQGGEVAIESRQITSSTSADDRRSAPCELIEITVSDTGPGIPSSIREHLFDPFYSGREAGRGLGFGLSKAWRIAELHGGSIELDDERSVGTSIVVRLPRLRPAGNSHDSSTEEN